jgi:hypothetical protein
MEIAAGNTLYFEVDGVADGVKGSIELRLKRDKHNAEDKTVFEHLYHGQTRTVPEGYRDPGRRFYLKQESPHDVWVNIYCR